MITSIPETSKSTPSNQVTSSYPIQALLLDDDAYDRTRIRRYTEKSGLSIDLEEASSLASMTNMVNEKSYDLVMIDYRLTEGNGLDALDIIRQRDFNKNAAVIMITGDDQSQTAVSAFRQGCHDFIVKSDLSADVLQTSVKGALLRSHQGNNQMHDLNFYMQNQIQQALINAIDGDRIQDALSHSLRQAVNSTDLGFDLEKMHNLESYLYDDEFIFKH